MKRLGHSSQFVSLRNAELMQAFRRCLAAAPVIRMPEIFRQVAGSPCSRFWVSGERAAIVVSAMEAGRPLPVMTPSKREMFAEIWRRYRILRAARPAEPLAALVDEVVCQPAPKFYFTPRSVGEFIYRIRNGFYDSDNTRLEDPRRRRADAP